MSEDNNRDSLIAAARRALENSYSPYSNFRVGAALRFADGTVVTGTNVENASYGLALCAETVAVAKAMDDGHRGGLEEVGAILTRWGGARARTRWWRCACPGCCPALSARPAWNSAPACGHYRFSLSR